MQEPPVEAPAQSETAIFADRPGAADTNGPTTSGSSPVVANVTLEGFEVLEQVGRGGMGVVFKARQRNLNRTVALKMILAGEFADEGQLRRFEAEAQAAAELDHPGIVPVYDVGCSNGRHYITMAFIEGASLAQVLKAGPLESAEAARLLKEVADAIAFAHRRGIIHRDLKPANILIDPSGHARVTDFGLSKRSDLDGGLTATGQILGTPSYMSPEQATGEKNQAGPAADIYSLGAVLYEMLTGSPPFHGETALRIIHRVLHDEPRPILQLNPRVSRDLQTITLRCLEKDPRRRYASADDLSTDLARFLAGEPIAARSAGFATRLWRHRKARRTLLLGGATTVFGVLVAVVVILLKSGYSDRPSRADHVPQHQTAPTVAGLDPTVLIRAWSAHAEKMAEEIARAEGADPIETSALQLDGWALVTEARVALAEISDEPAEVRQQRVVSVIEEYVALTDQWRRNLQALQAAGRRGGEAAVLALAEWSYADGLAHLARARGDRDAERAALVQAAHSADELWQYRQEAFERDDCSADIVLSSISLKLHTKLRLATATVDAPLAEVAFGEALTQLKDIVSGIQALRDAGRRGGEMPKLANARTRLLLTTAAEARWQGDSAGEAAALVDALRSADELVPYLREAVDRGDASTEDLANAECLRTSIAIMIAKHGNDRDAIARELQRFSTRLDQFARETETRAAKGQPGGEPLRLARARCFHALAEIKRLAELGVFRPRDGEADGNNVLANHLQFHGIWRDFGVVNELSARMDAPMDLSALSTILSQGVSAFGDWEGSRIQRLTAPAVDVLSESPGAQRATIVAGERVLSRIFLPIRPARNILDGIRATSRTPARSDPEP